MTRADGPGVAQARERLVRLGPAALSTSELLTLLGAAATGDPRTLLGSSYDALLLQLGPKVAPMVQATVELARRVRDTQDPRPVLASPEQVHDYLAPALARLPREVFHVLCLDGRRRLLADRRVAEGTAESCAVDPRDVFAAALASGARAIVLAHNHPSGDPTPSAEDLQLTRLLVAAGRFLNLRILDHVVVGESGFASLAARGEMGEPMDPGDRLRRLTADQMVARRGHPPLP